MRAHKARVGSIPTGTSCQRPATLRRCDAERRAEDRRPCLNKILDKPYCWDAWATPKGKDGKIDHNTAQTGDDLIAFVNQKLFPYLHGFKAKATKPLRGRR